jgi:pimeloyl-ACP methyl ester carboxylesterase
MPSTIRFMRQYLRPVDGVTTRADVHYSRGAERLPATVYRPVGRDMRLPGWVVLHGLTHSGRSHPALTRFCRAVARAGNVVFVPEIPEWRALRVEPDITIETIREAVRALQLRDDVSHEHVGLFGFSFGATQGLVAAADAETAGLLAGMASWGGYCDLRRLFRFGLTGLHEVDGTTYHTRPDPYGCWIMGANYLSRVPGHRGAQPVAHALHELAREAGEKGHYAWDPLYDEAKRRLRATLAPAQRELFDLIAPETTIRHRDEARLLELAEALAGTAIEVHPQLDPRPSLPLLRVPTLFAHGRDDRLIPFSESILLSRAVPARFMRDLTITALFQHSGGTQSGLGAAGLAREGMRFVRLLRRVLALV